MFRGLAPRGRTEQAVREYENAFPTVNEQPAGCLAEYGLNAELNLVNQLTFRRIRDAPEDPSPEAIIWRLVESQHHYLDWPQHQWSENSLLEQR